MRFLQRLLRHRSSPADIGAPRAAPAGAVHDVFDPAGLARAATAGCDVEIVVADSARAMLRGPAAEITTALRLIMPRDGRPDMSVLRIAVVAIATSPRLRFEMDAPRGSDETAVNAAARALATVGGVAQRVRLPGRAAFDRLEVGVVPESRKVSDKAPAPMVAISIDDGAMCDVAEELLRAAGFNPVPAADAPDAPWLIDAPGDAAMTRLMRGAMEGRRAPVAGVVRADDLAGRKRLEACGVATIVETPLSAAALARALGLEIRSHPSR